MFGTRFFGWQFAGALVKWGSITGNIADQTNLQAALDAKVNTASGNYYFAWFFCNFFSPADSTTYYFSSRTLTVPQTNTNEANINRVIAPFSGNIVSVLFQVNAQNSPSNETTTAYIVVNGTSAGTHLISNSIVTPVGAAFAVYYEGAINQPITLGDRMYIRFDTPNWVTNPTNTQYHACVILEKT